MFLVFSFVLAHCLDQETFFKMISGELLPEPM